MKKFIILSLLLMVSKNVFAEVWIPDYGYFENSNEISAKKEVISSGAENIFDFENSANPGGEKIQNGKYYVDVKYKGGYNGTDTDHVYLTDIIGKDGKDGVDGVGIKGDKGETGLKGEEGKQGLQGVSSKGLDNRVEGIVEVRVLDTKNTTWNIYGGYDLNNEVSIVGAKVTLKLGKSYTDKKLEELEKKIGILLQEKEDVSVVKDGEFGLKINTKF